MPKSRYRRWKRTALRLVLFYCATMILLSGCANSLLLHPSRQPVWAPGAQRVEVAGSSGPLELWITRSLPAADREPEAFVLHLIGNASRAESEGQYVTDQWHGRPVEIWTLNYPGFGGSSGPATMKSIPPAALAAWDAMKLRAGNRPAFVSGRSIGTTAALYVAAHRQVSGVILHSPPPLRRLIIGRFGWWNLWLAAVPVAMQVPADLDSIANARQASAPAIFIISGSDGVVPAPYQQKVADSYAGPKEFVRMPHADHNDGVEGEASIQFGICVDWLWADTKVR